MKKEVRFAGFGGQGIALAAYILGTAASIHADLNAVMTQNYGPESRGGASAADVVISDVEISYPAVSQPDILVFMSQEAYEKYKKDITSDTLLMVDQDIVKIAPDTEGHIYHIPFVRTADDMGKKIVANIVMLGAFTVITQLIPKDAMKKAILATVPARFKDLNDQAFERGCEVASEISDKQLCMV